MKKDNFNEVYSKIIKEESSSLDNNQEKQTEEIIPTNKIDVGFLKFKFEKKVFSPKTKKEVMWYCSPTNSNGTPVFGFGNTPEEAFFDFALKCKKEKYAIYSYENGDLPLIDNPLKSFEPHPDEELYIGDHFIDWD